MEENVQTQQTQPQADVNIPQQPLQAPEKPKLPKKKLLIIVGILLIMLVLSVGGMLILSQKTKSTLNTIPKAVKISATPTPSVTYTKDDIKNWDTFTSDFGYSFKYPKGGVVGPVTGGKPSEVKGIIYYNYDTKTKIDIRVSNSQDILNYPLEKLAYYMADANSSPGYPQLKEGTISGKLSYLFNVDNSFRYNTYADNKPVDESELLSFKYEKTNKYTVIFTENKGVKFFIFYPRGDNLAELILSTFKFN